MTLREPKVKGKESKKKIKDLKGGVENTEVRKRRQTDRRKEENMQKRQ